MIVRVIRMIKYIRKIIKQYPVSIRLSAALLFCLLLIVWSKYFNHEFNFFLFSFPIALFLGWLMQDYCKLKTKYLWLACSILFFITSSISNGWVNILTLFVLLISSMILAALFVLPSLLEKLRK